MTWGVTSSHKLVFILITVKGDSESWRYEICAVKHEWKN
jgi:hypothetical protein